MTNNDHPCKAQLLLRDLESVLTCVDYGYSHKEILEKYSCDCLKKFIDKVYITILEEYCGRTKNGSK